MLAGEPDVERGAFCSLIEAGMAIRGRLRALSLRAIILDKIAAGHGLAAMAWIDAKTMTFDTAVFDAKNRGKFFFYQ